MKAFFMYGDPDENLIAATLKKRLTEVVHKLCEENKDKMNKTNFFMEEIVNRGYGLIEEHPSDRKDIVGLYTLSGYKTLVKEAIESFARNDKEYFLCAFCGKIEKRTDGKSFEGRTYCPKCYANNFSTCDGCGIVHRRLEIYYIVYEDMNMCTDCMHRNGYRFCARCEGIYREEDMDYCGDCDDWFCDNCECRCDEECRDKYVHSYSYKPRPLFHGKGKRFYGIELEIDKLYTKGKFARAFDANVPESVAYLKCDGSLTERGVEVVSHPYSFDLLKKDFPFAKIIEMAREHGGLSHDTDTCGFHIHVSSESFANYELASTRILFVFERFWDQLVKLSRRNSFGYCEKGDEPKLKVDYVKNVKNISEKKGRYQAVNFCNDNTIEFRLWKGTLNIETIMATIELTDLICAIADSVSLIQLQILKWEDIKKMAKDLGYKTLLKYCKRRNV